MAFFSIGSLTIALAFATYYPLVITICLLLGFFDGCFITLLGPIAFELVGESGASQAIGCLLALCSVPLMVGPPVAGNLFIPSYKKSVVF